ncbi:MAG: GDSL family lipase [Parapedobacter sp.]|nr:MAG: GDSL family lipase [Parapedobacter sp.]
MLKITSFLLASGLFFALLPGNSQPLNAQTRKATNPLTFKQGERIVFLGGSLFENELEKGYLEYAITSRWPDLDLTFRNLGWTGDNVFAEARSTFTSPPTPYQHLFQQIRSSKPNHVLIAYGSVESQNGAAGLNQFIKGLEAIIDSLDAYGAKSILFSTIPVKHAGSLENTVTQNNNLKRYADAIAAVASKRKKRFVDIYSPIAANTGNLFRDNGIHLNDAGYAFLAQVLEEAFGWPLRNSEIAIAVADATARTTGPTKIIANQEGKIVFSFQETVLPFPKYVEGRTASKASVSVRISGLRNGRYALKENGQQLAAASAADWAKGVLLYSRISREQALGICNNIVKKNSLVFQQYRPMNRTYILGFRAYEQGRHKQTLEELNGSIAALEEQIKLHRKPVEKTYELNLIPTSSN